MQMRMQMCMQMCMQMRMQMCMQMRMQMCMDQHPTVRKRERHRPLCRQATTRPCGQLGQWGSALAVLVERKR